MSRDPDDDQILAAAVSGNADLIVTGDEDLLVLGDYRQIPIVTARDALSRLEQASAARVALSALVEAMAWCSSPRATPAHLI